MKRDDMKAYKVALVHDWLMTMGGAEGVLDAIYEIYPADIFTLICDYNAIKKMSFQQAKINTSFIQSLPFAKKHYRKYLPLMPFAIEGFDLSEYDIIISSSHAVAKGVITNSNQLHISYMHTPIRYAWDMYHLYLKQSGFKKGIKGLLAKMILHYIRIWDVGSINRVDYLIANSNYIKKRIWKVYKRDAEVIYPPVDVLSFDFRQKKEDYFITVSRMVPYKRIDLIVSAFSRLPDLKLMVIGDGPDMNKIKSIASKNVEFLGWLKHDELKKYMQTARCLVFAAEEDFGIVPVEAQACGCPVISYAKGGTLETVVNGKTGIYFYKQDVDSLINTVRYFLEIEDRFDPELIRRHSENFSKEIFKERFRDFIEDKIKRHLGE
ncbi:MAG: glycosyltransferase family 4 protein [Thermodesulfovibrionales bacterium]|nr:glycosyltransferase family 4 protein [Thermodesulfovibrionales bacterium]